jgi:hypothetical protein
MSTEYRKRRYAGPILLLAGSLAVGACERSPTEPPPSSVAISFMQGAPTHLNWGDRVLVDAFFPGQRSWQWMVGEEIAPTGIRVHPGWNGPGRAVGMACLHCHRGEERQLGAALVMSDPAPIPGKVGHKEVAVQAAYDAENFYLKVQWQSDRPGITHETYRFDGHNWIPNSRNKPAQLAPDEHFSYEDRFGVLIAERNIRADPALPTSIGFEKVGCWMTCHNNMRHMPYHPDRAGAQEFIGQDDVRKYLLSTRNGEKPKSAAEIAQMRADGEFIDLWQFRAARGAPVQKGSDDFVLEYRNADIGGLQMFFDQMPNDMRWMYDRAVVGFNAIPMSEYEERLAETPLIIEGPHRNAVPYDPHAGFAPGDILPRRVLRYPTGNRADLTTYSEWRDGVWTVIFQRALVTANTQGPGATDKALDMASGTVYTLGFGVFDDYTTSRRHFVTFPITLGNQGTNAMVRARAN